MNLPSVGGRIRRRQGFPVLPGQIPLVGHFPRLWSRALDTLREGAARVGPVFWVNLGLSRWFLFCYGPDSFKLLKDEAIQSRAYLDFLPAVMGDFLLVKDGAAHRHLRSALSKPFSPRGLSASGIGKLAAEIIDARVEGLAARGEVKILEEAQRLSLDIILRLVIGVHRESLDSWQRRCREYLLILLPVDVHLPGFPHYRAKRAMAWLDAQTRRLIADAREKKASEGLLSALVEARDDDDQPLTEPELVTNLRSLIIAGHETTASVMAWAVILLAQQRDLWDALCAEVAGVSEVRVPVTSQDLKRFPLAEAIFREALRLNPAIFSIIRRTAGWVEYADRRIPPDTMLAVSPYSVSHDPALFPEPDKFNPSRWMGRNAPPSPHELAQFGAGAHFCLGYHLALLESVQFLVALCRTMSGRGLRPQIIGGKTPRHTFVFTGHPTPGLRVAFTAERPRTN